VKRWLILYLVAFVVGLTAASEAAITLLPQPYAAVAAAFIGPFALLAPVLQGAVRSMTNADPPPT
jgi:hypothetical protein